MSVAESKTSLQANRAIDLFIDVSKPFQARFQKPLWNKHPEYLKDSLAALLIFLEGYAFERQGRDPAYSYAAVEAIEMVKDSWSEQDFPQIVWTKFSRLLEDKGLNKNRNPLYHVPNSCRCVRCAIGSANIILTSKENLAQGQVTQAWEGLQKIRGTGPKIASLFLRDIAVQFELIPMIPPQDRWRLQPVDVWVRRAVSSLREDKEREDANIPSKDKEIAEWLVNNCTKPELANQGIWYFGAQIAESKFRLDKAIKDVDYAWRIYREHIANLKAAAAVIES
jgi:hypothetical protein